MKELIDLIVKKTGISETMATTIVNIVVNYLTKKLPAPIATEVTGLLNNDAAIEGAEQLIGGLAEIIEESSKAKAAAKPAAKTQAKKK